MHVFLSWLAAGIWKYLFGPGGGFSKLLLGVV
jgi:hypothetical protein